MIRTCRVPLYRKMLVSENYTGQTRTSILGFGDKDLSWAKFSGILGADHFPPHICSSPKLKHTPYVSILWITLLPPILHFIEPVVPHLKANTFSFSNPTSIIGSSVGAKLIATWARENHFCQIIYLLSSTNNFVNQKISGYKVVRVSLIYRFHTKSFTPKGLLIAGRRVETLPRCN